MQGVKNTRVYVDDSSASSMGEGAIFISGVFIYILSN